MTVTNKYVLSGMNFNLNFLLLCVQVSQTELKMRTYLITWKHSAKSLGDTGLARRRWISRGLTQRISTERSLHHRDPELQVNGNNHLPRLQP